MDNAQPHLLNSGDEITTDWVRQALVKGGNPDATNVTHVEVAQLSDVANAMGSLFRCAVSSDAENAENVPQSVIVKLPTVNAIALRLANWMYLHRRELVYYRDIAPRTELKVPQLLYGDYDEKSRRVVLVMEDLGGMEGVPQLDGVGIDRARRAIREIATLQGQFWNRDDDPALAKVGAFLTAGQRRIMQSLFLLTLPLAFERFGELFSPQMRKTTEAFGLRIDAHFDAVAKGPKTIVHGDYRGDNVMYGRDENDEFAVIDWQGCGLGCGMYDVAFFLATSVTVEDRRAMERDAINEYHEIVTNLGATSYSQEDCWNSYRQNVLATLMPMVLGAGGIDVEDATLKHQTHVILERTIRAVEDLNSGEFIPADASVFTSIGAFRTLAGGCFKLYRGLLSLRGNKAS